MEFPAVESLPSNPTVWPQKKSSSPVLHSSNGENGFISAGFTSSSLPVTLWSRLCSCWGCWLEVLRSAPRRLSDCVLSPVPRRIYGTSAEDRFLGASAPPGSREGQPVGPAREGRFAGATAPVRQDERVSSNSDSPPYLPSQARVSSEGPSFRSVSGFRDLAV